jgi:hypothetical protein
MSFIPIVILVILIGFNTGYSLYLWDNNNKSFKNIKLDLACFQISSILYVFAFYYLPTMI